VLSGEANALPDSSSANAMGGANRRIRLHMN
jgi:hypothetical protein